MERDRAKVKEEKRNLISLLNWRGKLDASADAALFFMCSSPIVVGADIIVSRQWIQAAEEEKKANRVRCRDEG